MCFEVQSELRADSYEQIQRTLGSLLDMHSMEALVLCNWPHWDFCVANAKTHCLRPGNSITYSQAHSDCASLQKGASWSPQGRLELELLSLSS